MSVTDEAKTPGSGGGSSGPPRPPGQPTGGYSEGFDRTPPQDVAAEQSVLGGMLLSKDAIADVVEILKPGDFYRPAHTTIFDAILDLYGRGEPADPITVADALQTSGDLARIGGAPYLHTLMSAVPTAANASYYARIVGERAVLRRLVEAGTRIVQMGYGSAAGQGRDVDDVVDLAQQAIYEVTERRVNEDFAVLADLLQPALDEIEAVGARDGMMTGVPTGFGDLDRLLNGLHAGQLIIVAGRPGLGKALALDTPLPTPQGWTTMGQVRVGDALLDAEGLPTVVTALSDIMLDRPCYEVEFSDGSVIVADGSHRWLTQTRAARRRHQPADVVTTDDILRSLHTRPRRRDEASPHPEARPNHAVEATKPLALPERELPVAPYTLGVWLGGGRATEARFTTEDPEVVAFVEADGYLVGRDAGGDYAIRPLLASAVRHFGCVVCGAAVSACGARIRACGRACGAPVAEVEGDGGEIVCGDCEAMLHGATAAPCATCRGYGGSVTRALRELGLVPAARDGIDGPGLFDPLVWDGSRSASDTSIPMIYLRASTRQRRAILAGLADTTGTVSTTGRILLKGLAPRLAEDAYELVVSLGYRARVATDRAGRCTVSFATADDVFRLERKHLLHKERGRARSSEPHQRRDIVNVRRVPSVAVRCVSVANADHLYLAGRSMIPTHNSTAAMDFARSASVRHGQASAIFSLEMSKIEIVTRMLAAEAKVPLHVLRSGQLSDDDWTRLARRMGEISEAPVFVDDTPNMTLMEIRAKARRLRQRNDLKLVVVDYLQLMTSPKRVESRQQEVADLSRGLKLLAKEIECPVVAVSQLNRGPEQRTDKRPQLSDLRESGSIEQDADVVILLHRDDYYDKESPRAGEADFIVAKHRNGPTDTITVAAQLHFSRFVDMAVV